ncbi:catalytic domain of components of various dehydrogenase complexes [Pseudarthrobacter chlorophenolicus A6]|uniref:Dihydrolipoamide acetyltransferase component of pyruvate dehydrogenase complex n=1 Tax=Pseudarthrobacter chlorophenolicus (strain ATCC 700700 / DSM 12829 / CIP 107037 / JCM 12360 / KCTC 9906 / NCIMB 13794 / A6) TaxID=452863 RepID=B8HFQ2_PSECP|nr:dihydrolipoamide acetyltransferase family protein [Pseudarthrobacter chlorophenolicus]ACL39391.1 catalytic domain of components of various dehydrogenase complexes [Pseudarthrobacter chlorophenolicus A6]SDR00019.1 pyruvate dehydrogenase E2 component (dihydrolipoamide acetyltransferase) [Pseudarthrobacter chlorophenolicus]
MIKEFRLPDLGEGLTESEILSWKVAVGDTVSLNQVIAEVETAKAVVELPSPFAGVIRELHEQPGTVVEVGKPIVSFEVADDAGPAPAGHAAPSQGVTPAGQAAAGEEPAAPKREPNLVGYGAVVESSGRPARRPRIFAPVVEPADAGSPVVEPADAGSPVVEPADAGSPVVEPAETMVREARAGVPSGDRPRSTPPVRKLARDLGVDLAVVPGTGPEGLITREDVREFLRQGSAGQPDAPAGQAPAGDGGERETRTPIKGVRKHTAAAMVSSAFTAPHATEFLTVDVTPTMELLAKLRGTRAFAGLKLTPLTLAAKAVLIALRRHPSLNSRWDEANQEIVTFNYVNLGVAAATPRGLTVPNIKDAHSLTLEQLAEALAVLADTARSGKTAPSDLSGGTMSITNIGVFGIDAGTPILNPGEAAILALGAVRSMPWEYRGEVALRQVMTLSLSFDHRLVDGEQGSRFLADVGAVLAEPGMVLTMV